MNSKRTFHVTTTGRQGFEHYEIGMVTLTNEKEISECIKAMQEVIDDILDLQVGESMYFQSDRSDKTSKGIIFRNT